MPTKAITFDFFTFKSQTSDALEQALIKELATRKLGNFNNVKVVDFYARIREIANENDLWICNAEKVNVLDEAYIGDLQGSREALAQQDDQGPIFDTIFLYNPKNQVIALQRNRSGLGMNTFISYLCKLTSCDDVELEVIIDPNTLIKLNKMSLVKSIEYKISRPTNFTFARGAKRGLSGDIDFLRFFQGDSLKVVIGSDKGNKLGKPAILSKVKNLLTNSQSIEKLNVSGQIEGDMETIDLIKQRIIFTKKKYLKKHKKLTVDMIMETVKEAYNYHKTNLNRMYINRDE
ncbi:DUF6731 family protein [Gorillibacterium timonense]|uniref:DUF6731 family protein n=1 Tax=Gorillibacterium timonense TaxID=1689269 RepID=UPI00071D213E|nr:DUF6731 family protein [Gorillibacterium timonense]